MAPEFIPRRFIDEEIRVVFDHVPDLSKKPGPPDAFEWEGETHRVSEMLGSWTDYGRKGRAARNMQPAHLAVAVRRGSWGVGRFYFRLRTQGGRVFDLYYDRAPEGPADRAGHWFLYRELKEE